MADRFLTQMTFSLSTALRGPPNPTLITYLGETRELHCEIARYQAGRPVIWFFNGSRIEPYSAVNRTGNIEGVDFRMVSILTIKNITEHQEGNYECRVDDDIKSVDVIVLSEWLLTSISSASCLDPSKSP